MQKTDLQLYRDVVDRLPEQGYYSAAVSAHGDAGYPIEPFYTVRPPLLAYIHALVGETGSIILGVILVVIAAVVWHRRFATMPARLLAVCLVAFFGGGGLLTGIVVYLHDWWAGLLITIALGLKDWRISLAYALAAALLRELVIPLLLIYPLVNRKSLGPALFCLFICVAALAFHKMQVEAFYGLPHSSSPGWFGLRGPQAIFVDLAKLTEIPTVAGAVLVAIPAFGWIFSSNRLAQLWILGVTGALAVIARPDNFYWAQLVLPVYMVGAASLMDKVWMLRSRPPAQVLETQTS